MIISNKLKQEIKSQTSNVFVTSAIIKDLNSGLSENIEQFSTTPIESLSIMTNPVGALPIGKLEFEIGSVGDTQTFSENTTYEIHLQNKYTFDDGEIETFDTKKYVTTEIKYDQATGRTRFVALDYLNLLNKEYVPIDIAYPVRFDTWVQKFLDDIGLSANITNLFQKEYIVERQPNFLNDSNKQVLQKILEHSLSFGFIDDDNIFKIVRVSSLVTGSNVDTIDGSIKSYKANPDYFKTLGINTLVLGLQSDIADENVAKEDSAMIAIDGVVEMRLDDLPFAYDEQSKRNIIDSMFNEIKGFKYRAYESESKLFYLELGSLVRQEISDDGNYYNIPILSYTRVYNGSIMTKHASISESVIKTENAQKQFSPRKKTEIRLNKIDQEFSVVHEKTDELDTKYSNISSDIDSINLGVYKKTEVDQKLEDIIITTTEHSSAIAQTQNSIAQEIIERTTQGELLLEQTSSLVQQTVNSFDVIFNKLENDQNLDRAEIELIQSYFRINENGVIIGKSNSAIEFFAENNRVGFREGDNDIAYWEEGTMNVERLIAITTIMVGYHLIEKYDSPIAGNTTIVRIGD